MRLDERNAGYLNRLKPLNQQKLCTFYWLVVPKKRSFNTFCFLLWPASQMVITYFWFNIFGLSRCPRASLIEANLLAKTLNFKNNFEKISKIS